jgi:hypothetical protein
MAIPSFDVSLNCRTVWHRLAGLHPDEPQGENHLPRVLSMKIYAFRSLPYTQRFFSGCRQARLRLEINSLNGNRATSMVLAVELRGLL